MCHTPGSHGCRFPAYLSTSAPPPPGQAQRLRAVLVGSWDQFRFENLEVGLAFFFLLGNEPCISLKMMFVSVLPVTGRLRESGTEQDM